MIEQILNISKPKGLMQANMIFMVSYLDGLFEWWVKMATRKKKVLEKSEF